MHSPQYDQEYETLLLRGSDLLCQKLIFSFYYSFGIMIVIIFRKTWKGWSQLILIILGMFTNIVARWPRSTHDSFISNNSHIGQSLESGPNSIENGLPQGASGSPCKPYVITPYLNLKTAKQEAHNKSNKLLAGGSAVSIFFTLKYGWSLKRPAK